MESIQNLCWKKLNLLKPILSILEVLLISLLYFLDNCKKRLVEVFENEYNTYVFDSVSGTYKEHEWKGEIEIFCPYCNTKLYEVFPDGVCNYVWRNKSREAKSIDKKEIMS